MAAKCEGRRKRSRHGREDEAAQPRVLGGHGKRRSTAVLTCGACRKLSSQVPWASSGPADQRPCKSEELLDRGPADDACQSCWTMWRDAFAFVTWETFCKESNTNPKFQAKVDEAKAREGATDAPIRSGSVQGENTFRIEVREAVELVTEQELTHALNTRVLPKHMRSIPLLRVPSRRVGATAQTLAPEWEECYAFRDPEATRRKGSIVWTTGVVATKMVLPHERWNGHALAQWAAEVEATADQPKANAVHTSLRGLPTLIEFVSAKAKPKKRKGTLQRVGTDDADEGPRCRAAGVDTLRGEHSSSEHEFEEEEPDDELAAESYAAPLGCKTSATALREDVSLREWGGWLGLGVAVKTCRCLDALTRRYYPTVMSCGRFVRTHMV